MQPTLAVTVPAAGIIDLNGRFLGEASPEQPLLAPVSPFGAVYLEYKPLVAGWLPLARRIVMSSGSPLPDSLAEDVYAIRWPGFITEIELAPVPQRAEVTEAFVLDGVPCRIVRGERSRIEVGELSCPFPKDGSAPEVQRLNGCAVLTGTAGDSRYILTLSDDLTRQTGFLQADRLEIHPDGSILATVSKGDLAGHAVEERWQAEPTGLRLAESEAVWLDGSPREPSNPEEAARMCLEAALLGLFDEAEGWLSPALRARHPLDAAQEAGSLCLPMKYGFPDGRPCVGLLKVETGSCAVVQPVYYRAERLGGRWLLTELEL